MTFLVKHPGTALATLPQAFAPAPALAPAGETMTIDFRGVSQSLWRRKWMIALPFVLFSMLGVAAALLITPKYTASVHVLVDPREVQLLRPDAGLRAQIQDINGSQAENAIVVMRSSNLLMKVVEKENLVADPEFAGKPGPVPLTDDQIRLRAMTNLDKRLGVRRPDRSSIIEASVATNDPVKSARIANTLARLFIEQQSGVEGETARRAAQAVTSRLDELGSRVQTAERAVEEYKARNNLQTANGKLVGEQQLQELNTQLVLARTRTSDARSKYDSVRKLSVQAIERGELPDTANSAVIGQLRLKFAEASRLEADARTKLGAKHPEMVALSAQVRDMRTLIADELSRQSRSAQAEYERAKASEDSLARSLDQLKSQSSDAGGALVRLRELERQAEASKEIYSSFLKRARELGEQEDIGSYNARVVSAANPPQYPSGLPKSVIAAGAGFAGLMIGLMLALLAEQFDQTLRSRAQIQQAAGLPVIGEMAMPGAARSRGAIAAHVLERPRDAYAVGACRIADAFAGEVQPQGPRSVLFLSVNDAPNLTEQVLNVSIAAAQATWRVLMIDASGAGITRHLDMLPNNGLADVIDRRCGLTSAILTDDRTEVRILPAFGGTRQPALRRLSPQQVHAQVLAQAQGFELVLVDGGVLGRDATALAFAGAVDDIVLVAAAGQTSRKQMREAVEFLAPVRDRLRGVIAA